MAGQTTDRYNLHRMFHAIASNRTTEVTIFEHSDRGIDRRWYTLVERDRRPWMHSVITREARIDDPAGWRGSSPRDPQCPAARARELARTWLANGPATDAAWWAGHPNSSYSTGAAS